MRSDLFTLYCLAIGTLLVSAALTFWEREAKPKRARELRLLAMGYTALAAGCATAMVRGHVAGAIGAALSNIIFVTGYLLVLNGAAAFRGRQYWRFSAALVVVVACGWVVGGARHQENIWNYISAIPIALASGLTALELHRSTLLRTLRSYRIVVLLPTIHALCYFSRAFLLPWGEAIFGRQIGQIASAVTMYEGVLYSVGLPMALLALVREETQAQLLEASRTDYLTGLGNRRWFFETGERRLRTSDLDESFTLLAFDLDHFKSINDQHGHATGDTVLRLFAGVARDVVGPEAILARIGGEEFVALLPGYGRLFATELGRALAIRFAEAVPGHPGCDGVAATVSIGLAEHKVDGDTLTDLLSAADRALYLAKARGRNRIEPAPSLALAEVG